MNSSTIALLFLSLLLPLTSTVAWSQETKNPIDKNLDACLASSAGSSTVGQLNCADKAAAAWDHELNQSYGKLMKTLDPASQTLLRNSQRQWLAFRDAEKNFEAGPWRAGRGTLAGVIASMANVDILRSRALTLRNYLP